ISNFVPHGYAVAQISVFGSGRSNHCFDMFGLSEQLGVHGAVEWLGGQAWSNGNVGLIGRSYDGSTPWMAAAHASEGSALKTIVPISGLSGLQDLVTWNGASETRVALFQNVIYATFGLEPGADPEFANQIARRATCPDWTTSTAWGAAGYLEGDGVVDVEGSYWQERNMGDRVIENYRGSVYMIHGLQDDNVDPHAGWILHKILEDGGWETKGLYGQWYHSYPDRPGEHGGANQEPRNSVRYDWAQDLLEWFDHYLKGSSEKPALIVEVQEHSGAWRVDDKLQPSNSRFDELPLSGGDIQVTPAAGGTVALGPFDEDLVMGGLSTLKLSVTPLGPGGQIFVNLINMETGEDFGLSYGVMELRHATGQFAPVVPGQTMDIEIPIQYFSDVLPAGDRLGVVLSATGNNYLPSPVVTPVTVHADASSLSLSVVEPEASDYFLAPEWLLEE
ncbi:MAG: CocE/NonD family hydrolase, partial [Thermoplasmatota archaeon]